MALKLALNPFRDPAEGIDWEEQARLARQELTDVIRDFPEGQVACVVTEGDHGIGAGEPRIILEIVGIASLVFFGIPAAHKKIREAIEEWRRIAIDVRKVVDWIAARFPVTAHSIEVAFYLVLQDLESDVAVDDLVLIEASLVWYKADAIEVTFETAPGAYYLFVFREGDERLHLVVVDSHLRIHIRKSLPLDPRFPS